MSLVVVIEERSDVFVLFRLLNDRSAEQVVTGRVANMVNKTLMLGYILVVSGSVLLGQSEDWRHHDF